MIEIKLLKVSAVSQLFEAIESNLEIYRTGSFDILLQDSSLMLASSCTLDPSVVSNVVCSTGNDNEVECCLNIHAGLKGITPYMARDERLWARLSHIEFLDYSRTRWPIPDDKEKAISHIKKHFFAKGARGIERDNSISRLWWLAEICHKVEGLSLKEALTAFLYQSDVRANIVERPTTSQNAALLSAVINKLHESYKTKEKGLYERSKFRSVMKKLNIEGGVRLLEVLDANTLGVIIDKVSE